MADPDRRVLDAQLLRPSGALLAAQIAVRDAIEREAVAATDHDATTLDLLVRLDLEAGHRLRAVELCRRLRLSPSHISRMIDRAEAAGLVTREPDPLDGRAKQVVITEAGRAVAAEFAPRLHAVLQGVIHDALDDDEIETLISLLGRVERAADDR